MKASDYKGVLNALSEASPSHLALASFVISPIVLDYWLQSILKLFPTLDIFWKVVALVTLLIIYIFCLIWLAKESSIQSKLATKRDLILARLSSNGWKEMGFNSARVVLGKDCSDEEIHHVIQAFPRSLRFVSMRSLNPQDKPLKDDATKKFSQLSMFGEVFE